jgi:hypothetical protein
MEVQLEWIQHVRSHAKLPCKDLATAAGISVGRCSSAYTSALASGSCLWLKLPGNPSALETFENHQKYGFLCKAGVTYACRTPHAKHICMQCRETHQQGKCQSQPSHSFPRRRVLSQGTAQEHMSQKHRNIPQLQHGKPTVIPCVHADKQKQRRKVHCTAILLLCGYLGSKRNQLTLVHSFKQRRALTHAQ